VWIIAELSISGSRCGSQVGHDLLEGVLVASGIGEITARKCVEGLRQRVGAAGKPERNDDRALAGRQLQLPAHVLALERGAADQQEKVLPALSNDVADFRRDVAPAAAQLVFIPPDPKPARGQVGVEPFRERAVDARIRQKRVVSHAERSAG
jgi:hypothetical protein